ncbi:MAG: trypsin-like peptidase domain-containing protein [Verrucomicrobia bacterium]|nr:trypsin-like peptidase domain-containing protein [Verrucomicrobiota bacterium]
MLNQAAYRSHPVPGRAAAIEVIECPGVMPRLSRMAGVLLLLLSTAGFARSQDTLASISADVQRIYESAKGAVVRIESEDDFGKLAGTGFLIDPNGTIYTAYDVGGESRDITVEFGSKRYPGHRLVADAKSGVAILKVDANTPWIPLGNSDELKLASPIVSIGYPLDLPATPSFGLIGGFDLKYLNRYFSTTLVRANLPVQKGEAGSPILNLKGQAVGILIRSIGNESACYALPMKAAEKIRADYVRYGAVRPGWLGVSVRERDYAIKDSKVEVSSLEEHSPAENSGLRVGDTLLQVGQVKVRIAPDALNVAFFLTVGDRVPVTVVRDGKDLTFKLTVADMPASPNQAPSMLIPGLPSELRSPAEFPSYP